MNWSHIKLIFHREVRDQLRDRRTMFTICVLPILLYPLMGMVMLQVAQFHREQHVSLGVFGYENWPTSRPLITEGDETQIHWKKLITTDEIRETLNQLRILENNKDSGAESQTSQNFIVDAKLAEKLLKKVQSDAIIWIPKGYDGTFTSTQLVVLSNQRWERSQLAVRLLAERLDAWHQGAVRDRLASTAMGVSVLDPPQIKQVDVSVPESKRALIWTKILPFVMLVWALTGAFYPAIDLCAGEKERGTLETLLCSPARRKEIVWGKLLTVMCFSVCTALLNLFSMHFTTAIVMTQFSNMGATEMVQSLGPLPIQSMGWLLLLVIPISAMFSALALAVASLARSTKEGQYYLMPLLLVGMPLVMLPMIPGVLLSPGTSVIPVTGAVLMSRAMMDGEYTLALLHLPTVATITVLCCLLSVRWAVRQFESESVMFRDSERSSVSQWIRNVWRHRDETPSVNESFFCGLIILICLFFGRLSLGGMTLEWASIVKSTLVIQMGVILGPALIMAAMLTRSITKSLRLSRPSAMDLAVTAGLAFCLHPTYVAIATAVSNEYKLGDQTTAMLMQFDAIIGSTSIWYVLLVLALLPAVCEELVFRGFLFAGLMRNGGHVRAILVTAVLFGLSHGVLQQSITASIMGLVLGWLAYRTGGVACTIVFHVVHNSISMLLAASSHNKQPIPQFLSWALEIDDGRLCYSAAWSTLSVGVAISLVAWLATRNNKDRRSNAQKSWERVANEAKQAIAR